MSGAECIEKSRISLAVSIAARRLESSEALLFRRLATD